MGDRDFVPGVVRELGGEVLFHRVPQRPGGPVLGAALPDGRAILGLPGNPLSVISTGRRLLAPVLRVQAGCAADPPPPSVTLVEHDGRRLDMWWFRLVRLVSPGIAELVSTTSSGDFAAAARADGFIEIPPGQAGVGPWPFYGWSI
jgi:molybdopterin molybdotransferase